VGKDPPSFLRVIAGGASKPSAPAPDALATVARSAADGDPRATRTFLLTVTPHLLRVVRRVLGTYHPDVDDTAQESAFALMDALPRHRGECTVLHFACRVALLTAMNVRRREATRKRSSTRQDELDVELLESAMRAPDEELLAQARASVVRELVDTLPVEQAEVLAMHCVLGYTVKEIADTSRAPVETVRSRLRLAKGALRDRIAHDPRLGRIVGGEP
jgi:RNA polymerase sigma-70 factor (ECF subfamily)